MSVPAAILDGMTCESTTRTVRLAGIVTAAQLLAAGRSQRQIAAAVGRGELIRLRRGLYATAELAGTLALHPAGERFLVAAAALAALGPPAAASHETAAQLHELDLLARPGVAVAVTRPPGHGSRTGACGVVLHTARLPPQHVGQRFGVPVTTVPRTVIDLARTLEFRAGVVTADSALHQRLTSKAELARVLAECPRSRGARKAAHVVDFASPLSESVLESIARVAFRDLGLPPPQLQVKIGGDQVFARVDFLWPQYRTIAEADGALKYDDRSAAIRQLRRDDRLYDAGYQIVHFTWQEITQNPDQVAVRIRAAFRRGIAGAAIRGPAA